MKINYDLHLHTALSPCATEEMTPNNIVNMSIICGLDVIAVTDHNSCDNVAAVMKVAEGTDLLVIPGIEVETAEEVHVICLFEHLQDAYKLQEEIYRCLPPQKSNARIFGEQLLLNEKDDVVGKSEKLLSFAVAITLDELVEQVNGYGGICIPAHIDRPSYSIISNLGMLPEHLCFPVLELSRYSRLSDYQDSYKNHFLLQSSDAHELGCIGICNASMEVEFRAVHSILQRLKHGLV